MEAQLTAMRGELIGYAYRMLGSPFEAEDAVQESMLRVWKHADDFDPGRGSLRTWVYRILTNVCVDMLRASARRSLDLVGAPGGEVGEPLPSSAWVLPRLDDPATIVQQRDSVRLAFVAALQHLPPRQRAVLILRDVLCWHAAEVAGLLGVSVAAVTSSLQRARVTLRAAGPGTPATLGDAAQRSLVDRYCDAFHRFDVPAMIALLHEDATTSMPPFRWWVRGRAQIGAVMAASDSCHGARLTPVRVNGVVGFWQHRPTGTDGAYEPFALVVPSFGDELITGLTTFLGFAQGSGFPQPIRSARETTIPSGPRT